MNLFQFFYANKIFVLLYLFSLIIDFSFPEPCNYTKGNISEYLNGNHSDENKLKCFALSYSFENQMCCYNAENNLCYQNTDNMTNETDLEFDCPTQAEVPNNCGFAGIFEPSSNYTCTEIPLVQGYCCYVTLKINGQTRHSCLREKILNKNKSKPTEDLIKHINNFDSNIEIESVQCGKFYIKYYWLLNFIITIIILS